jgi:hypothetical protein
MFSLTDAAELGVAIDLQDIGVTQGEFAQWVRVNRGAIRAAIDRVLAPDQEMSFWSGAEWSRPCRCIAETRSGRKGRL